MIFLKLFLHFYFFWLFFWLFDFFLTLLTFFKLFFYYFLTFLLLLFFTFFLLFILLFLFFLLFYFLSYCHPPPPWMPFLYLRETWANVLRGHMLSGGPNSELQENVILYWQGLQCWVEDLIGKNICANKIFASEEEEDWQFGSWSFDYKSCLVIFLPLTLMSIQLA